MESQLKFDNFSKKIDSWYCSWRDISFAGSLADCISCVELTAWKYSQRSALEILLSCQMHGRDWGGNHIDDTNWSVEHESLMQFDE